MSDKCPACGTELGWPPPGKNITQLFGDAWTCDNCGAILKKKALRR